MNITSIAKAFINKFQLSQILFENSGRLLWLLLFALIFSIPVYSQSEAFRVKNPNNSSLFYVQSDGSIGVDTSTILGSLTLNGTNGIIATGTIGSGTALNLGAGTRMMWYPKKAAFREGNVNGSQWNDANIGDYSFASGYSTTASGYSSSAMGLGTTASGYSSTAIGYYTTASGQYSTAMGEAKTASGYSSTAIGNNTTASGNYSTAMGYYTTASGNNSTAMGGGTTASGDFSTAMGNTVSTNSFSGSFIIGDNSTTRIMTSSLSNQMMMRFTGGYLFYTSISPAGNGNIGAKLDAGANSWSTISDSTKKYAFLPVNDESVLNKIDKFDLRTWSYKGQDSTKFRHYGPMAQEFFAAFGHDKYGVAGNDTTINQADFEGINLIAIQALEKRTDKLQKKLKEKDKEMTALKNNITTIESSDAKLKEALVNSINANQNLNARLQQVESAVLKLKEVKVVMMKK